jgi:2-succinyl-5-enolpyruvyl-6-hydroxy-3-cyclohexene-1-carboxylate synthase
MNAPDVTTSFATIFVDALAAAGVRHAVVAPGSRNTPLVLALARHPDIVTDVVLDERSAAFRALGIGIATGSPAVVCCTSGTAVANLHPAVLEAHHACVPLLVCTADRPPELRDWGAPQTVDQAGAFANAVRWYHDPGPPEDLPGAPARWRALAARAVDSAMHPVAGPVHLNLPFREPLVPTGGPLIADAPQQRVTRTNVLDPQLAPSDAQRLAARIAATERGLVVAGFGARVDPQLLRQFSESTRWPVFADPLSNARSGGATISTYDALARVDAFTRAYQPDLVVRVGAPLTSKAANAWLADVPTVLVDPAHRWLDPTRTTVEHVGAGADATLRQLIESLKPTPPTAWTNDWLAADARARAALDKVLDEAVDCEARIARDLADAIPEGGSLVVGSSVPVRALEWAMRPRYGLHVAANRGANGIDGFVSTVGGVAAGNDSRRPVVGLTGDLGFLHDTNGLGALGDGKLVVVDNNGGAIFSYLPPRDLPEFERLFTTPHHLDLVAVARARGVDAERVEAPDDWAGLLKGGPPVVVVPLDAAAASDRHQAMWDAVATAFGG